MWPDKFPHLGPVLDGVEEEDHKPEVTYRIRIARDPEFKSEVMTAERNWAFFNPFKLFEKGKWYWQHAYLDKDGKEEWSPVYHFYVDEQTRTFNPPSLQEVLAKFSQSHPRILLDAKDWDQIIERNKNNPEAQLYIQKARKCLNHPLKHLEEEIDTTQVVKLTNIVQYRSALIRESRKIVDREEANIEAMVRAWYNLLTPAEKQLLLETISENAHKFYHEYVNHLENRIADNHVWQMTFRILNMAAFATYGELPMASTWVDYCYNEWVSRLPGLNTDGGWHNGDSYFHVNLRTLIEVPAFYSRISGFDFFADPWYNNNVLYVIYHQPPFSKSAGHGNSHETKMKPNGTRVGYADALARECNNPWAAAYARTILEKEPDIMKKSFLGKAGDLTWYRCITDKALPKEEHSLAELPMTKVFNETGIATMHTSLGDIEKNAMLSFRSSPYGSTSHALANQNAFNTFYGGKAIFYSSGHRTGFTDDHCMYSYRNTRAHNSILVNGMTQTIGTEGYGWIPRWYEGEKISYMVGDASNAYGKITAPIWLKRGELSGTQYTPEKGWDENKLKMFRRHIIQLGNTGVYVIYDELEGKEAVTWSYLLHTVELPMEMQELPDEVKVTGKNKDEGISVAHLFSSAKTEQAIVDTFFCAPTNWKNVTNAQGKAVKYPNHWHFSSTTIPCKTARFLTVMDTYGNNRADMKVVRQGNTVQVGDWIITCNLTEKGKAAISVTHQAEKVSLKYDAGKKEGATIITDQVQGKQVNKVLTDYLPDFEI